MDAGEEPAGIDRRSTSRTAPGRHPDQVLDRVAAYEGAAAGLADHRRALNRLRGAQKAGFDALLAEHRRAWAARWEDADIVIEGDDELQLADPLGAVPPDGERGRRG